MNLSGLIRVARQRLGARQPSAALEIAAQSKSGRGLPQSKTSRKKFVSPQMIA
jgi:hypothetical protein